MHARQVNSTAHPILFRLALSSDHYSAATGLSPAVTLSKDGGAFAAAAGAVTELGSGWYALAGHAADRATLGTLAVRAAAATADDYAGTYAIVNYDPYDPKLDLAATGLDAVVVDDTINARQALAVILAADAGLVAGAGTGTVVVKAARSATTQRLSASCDAQGNRTAVTITPPA